MAPIPQVRAVGEGAVDIEFNDGFNSASNVYSLPARTQIELKSGVAS